MTISKVWEILSYLVPFSNKEATTDFTPSHIKDDLSDGSVNGILKKAGAGQRRVLPSIIAAAAAAALLFSASAAFSEGRPAAIMIDLFAVACLLTIILINYFSGTSGRQAIRSAESGWKETRRKLQMALEHADRIAAFGERSNRARSEFLAHMSHEIRTPLNGVIGMARLLLGTELNIEQREYAEAVKNRAEALLQTITDILDFSKIEAGKMILEVIPFDLRVTLEDIIDMFSLQLYEKQLDLICLIDPDIPSLIKGDPGRLRQVLINLIGNAVKFTEKGEVSVKVNLESDENNRITLHFSVADTGIGIAEALVASLFHPYQQADTSTARKYGGTGLGLSISKQLVERMGGTIGVDSTPGMGSTFWFTVVLEKQAPHESQIREMAADIKGVPVLVVDENKTNRHMLEELLNHWECLYDEATDGETAFAKLQDAASRAKPFRIVILDAEISGTSGEMLGARIMREPAFSAPQMIMMTSLGNRGDVARLESAGFSAYLTKPIKQCQLLDCLLTLHGNQAHPALLPEHTMVTRHTLVENRRRRLKILLVEDDVVSRKVTINLLERLGYLPDTAENGKMAMAALENRNYDLILMDCVMPVMNGFETAREMRRMNALKQIPIIAMTAHTGAEIGEKCIESGMNDYISKPVTSKQLAETIDKWTQLPETLELLELPQIPVPPQMIFDRADLINRLMGDEGFARELAVQFLKDLPRRRSLLKMAIDQRNAEAVRLEAHSLKGSATNLSAPALREISYRIETAAAEGKTETAHHLLRELDSQIQHFKNALILSKLISLDDC